MDKKYQIFISSTYEDLKEERQQVVQTVLQEGHIPAGMELFGQDDRKQWEVIQEWINASDIFLIMVKNRYGTICKDTGISYTQMEYEYAGQLGKPIIKVVFNKDINSIEEEKEEEYKQEKLKEFRNRLLEDCVVTPISNEGQMVQRIIDKIQEYSERLKDVGWCRYEDMERESYYQTRYKLIQYLMFAEDRYNRGHNRFTVLPKVMMLQEMKNDSNPVNIGELDIEYTIEANEMSDEKKVYDCRRKWTMHAVKNVSSHVLETYSFYTGTDIGKRNSEKGRIKNYIHDGELMLSDKSSKNNGISCWKWNLNPEIDAGQSVDVMILEEYVEGAWDFNRKQEIIYFIPKCFGQSIGTLNITVEADASVASLDMEMFEIKVQDGEPKRSLNKTLDWVSMGNGKYKYGTRLPGCEIEMENVYYIVIKPRD